MLVICHRPSWEVGEIHCCVEVNKEIIEAVGIEIIKGRGCELGRYVNFNGATDSMDGGSQLNKF